MLEEYLTTNIFAFLLVFTRIGSIFMVAPGFGEGFVSPRVRLSLALAVSFLITQFVVDQLPPEPANVIELLVLLSGEIVVGLIIGGALRLAVSALHIAGTIIAQQSGLAAAQFFDPGQMTQGAVTSSFLTLMGMTMIFVTDLHHLMLQGTYASYTLFKVGAIPPLGDVAELIGGFVAGSFQTWFSDLGAIFDLWSHFLHWCGLDQPFDATSTDFLRRNAPANRLGIRDPRHYVWGEYHVVYYLL